MPVDADVQVGEDRQGRLGVQVAGRGLGDEVLGLHRAVRAEREADRAAGDQLQQLIGAQPRGDHQDVGLDRPGAGLHLPAAAGPGDRADLRLLADLDPAGRHHRPQQGRHRGHVGEPGVDVQPAAVGRELRESLGQRGTRQGLTAQLQLLQHGEAAHGVTRGHVGGHARLDQVQAAAVDEQPLAGALLQVQPELPGLEGQPRVLRIEVVVAHRPGQRERGGARITDPRLVQHGDRARQRRRVVRRHQAHDAAADDGQPAAARSGQSALPSHGY